MKALTNEARALLTRLLEACEAGEAGDGSVLAARFRADHATQLDLLDGLVRDQYIQQDRQNNRFRVGVIALPQLEAPVAKVLFEQAERLWEGLRDHYLVHLDALIAVPDLARACGMASVVAQHTLRYMLDVPWYGGYSGEIDRPIESIAATERVIKYATFLKLIEEVRSWTLIGPAPGGSSCPTTDQLAGAVTQVPDFSRVARTLPEWLYKLPVDAQALMREVHVAMAAELFALSAMGIRAVVDVVSQDKLGGDAGTFVAKLKALRDAGHMAEVQYEAMLVVVDAGNAAAHRGHIPAQDSVRAMLVALEHLLQSLYVLKDVASELSRVTPKRTPGHRAGTASSVARQDPKK